MTDTNDFLNQILALESELLAYTGTKDFSDIACDLLKAKLPFKFNGMNTLVECLHFAKDIPQYYSSTGFGKFNLTLVNNGSFFIIAMFMDGMSTEIHDHPFQGVFTSLMGSPFQISFEFQNSNKNQNDWKQSGHLKISKFQQIDPGDLVQIRPGFIHQLSRLENKQFSLLVAQKLSEEECQNHFYLYPNLKIKNRINTGHLARFISSLLAEPIDRNSIHKVFELFELNDILELYLRTGMQLSQSDLNDQQITYVRDLAKNFLMDHSDIWETIKTHEKFMLGLKTKLSIQI